jgi:hypothetical protein
MIKTMVWVYDDPVNDPYEKKMYKILFKLFRNKDIAHRGARNLGLFKFMSHNKFESPSELRRNILLDDKPLFKPADAKVVWTFFQQKGGALTPEQLKKINEDGLKQLAEQEPLQQEAEEVQGSYQNAEPSTEDPTQAEDTSGSAYDAIVDRWLKFWFALTPEFIKDPINMVSPFMYPLKTLESIPVYGDTLALAVDVAAQMNKNAAKMAQMYTPMLMGFLPIPEASTVGIVVGYMISTIFIFFNMIIFTTRHHFGEAFKQSLALIPFVGMALENFADSGDGLLGRYGKARLRIIDQLNESGIFSWLGWLITWTTVDPFYQGDPDQDAEWVKSMASEHLNKARAYGSELYTNVQENLNNPEKRAETVNMFKERAQELKERAQQSVDQARNSQLAQTLKDKTSQGLSSLGDAVAPPPLSLSQKLSRGVGLTKEGTVEKMRRKASETLKKGSTIGKQGGKRFSKIRRHKGKWRTQKLKR